MQKQEALEEEKTALERESTEIISKADKSTMEENEKKMLHTKEEEEKANKAVEKSTEKRDSVKLEESIMEREIKNLLEEGLIKTGGIFAKEKAKDLDSKANMFAKEDTKDKSKAKEDNKDLFEQVEEMLDNASWQHLIQQCLQNISY